MVATPAEQRQRTEQEHRQIDRLPPELAADAGEEQHGGVDDREQQVAVRHLPRVLTRGRLVLSDSFPTIGLHPLLQHVLGHVEGRWGRIRVFERARRPPCCHGRLERFRKADEQKIGHPAIVLVHSRYPVNEEIDVHGGPLQCEVAELSNPDDSRRGTSFVSHLLAVPER